MVGFEEEEAERPSFYGRKIISAVDGKPKLHHPSWIRGLRTAANFGIILGASIIAIGTVAAVFTLRSVLAKFDTNVGTISTGLIFAVQIQVFNNLFDDFAIGLNDRENHRTDTEYVDALVLKVSLFQSIICYTPLFYIAFLKPFLPSLDPCVHSCMSELEVTVEIIFLFRLLWTTVSEVSRGCTLPLSLSRILLTFVCI